jgi:7,8-dihydropterin-6-yl-methyl-4-(beta-D-ribofuranosyl)aminobenzene 5'-phosphate synthase
MKVSILTDNSAGPRFIATHGFSCYIEADINVLFDTGPDNTFMENASRLHLDLHPDFIVLSHGHWDHGDGLKYFNARLPLVCHPACFTRRYSRVKNHYVGISLSKEEAGNKFRLIESKSCLQLSPSVYFLGEIPRINDFEAKTTDFVDVEGHDDFISDDSALAIKLPDGLVIISGCSHSGICNIVDYAISVTGEERIIAVMGGFHLKSIGYATQRTIQFFKDKNVKQVLPSHCTSLPALSLFYQNFHNVQVLTGNYYFF